MEYAADVVLHRVVLVEVEKLHPGGHAFDPDNAKQLMVANYPSMRNTIYELLQSTQSTVGYGCMKDVRSCQPRCRRAARTRNTL